MQASENKNLSLVPPPGWADYELIDCGDFEKLERFGKFIITRPEPQAIWPKAMKNEEWEKLSQAHFSRDNSKKSHRSTDNEAGGWNLKPGMPDHWQINYQLGNTKLRFKLALTAFGHIGVFPEQASNWQYIYEQIQQWENPTNCKVLNLFAYTGGISLAAKAAGAEVTHVDSVKSIISWANENQQNSGLDNIRWVVEDALKFTRREASRGNIYQGIVLDPPAYGRGPKGEKWLLQELLPELLEYCSQILDKQKGFLIINLYSMGWSALMAENIIRSYFEMKNVELGEFYIPSKSGLKLPLGIFLRFNNF